jgi:hypothetical protein
VQIWGENKHRGESVTTRPCAADWGTGQPDSLLLQWITRARRIDHLLYGLDDPIRAVALDQV